MESSTIREQSAVSRSASRIRRASAFKPVTLIVHTRRDLSQIKFAHGMRKCIPPSVRFLSASEVAEVRRAAPGKNSLCSTTSPPEAG